MCVTKTDFVFVAGQILEKEGYFREGSFSLQCVLNKLCLSFLRIVIFQPNILSLRIDITKKDLLKHCHTFISYRSYVIDRVKNIYRRSNFCRQLSRVQFNIAVNVSYCMQKRIKRLEVQWMKKILLQITLPRVLLSCHQ